MRTAVLIFTCCWLIVSCVQGGTQQQHFSTKAPLSDFSRDYIAEVEGFEAPANVDQKLFSELKAALLEGLINSGKLRGSSAATKDSRSQSILAFNDLSQELEWGYYSTGDYDQNGEVNVADITPIVFNFGQTGPFEVNSTQAVVDGDTNGEINLADITPIVLNFGAVTTSFEVFTSPEEVDYPTTPGDVNGPGAQSLGSVAFDSSAPATDRRQFSFELVSPDSGFFWIRPTDVNLRGTPSTILQLDFTPNLLPVVDLIASPQKGDLPLEVSFDARGSTDDDGEIVLFEFDWDGAANGEQWIDNGSDGTIMHTYTSLGLFDATLRVTDDRGGQNTAVLQISVSVPGNDPPLPVITADPQAGELPLLVEFDASLSFDPDNEIAKYEWDLDGELGYEQDTGVDPTAKHTYYENQDFEAFVRVTDEDGLAETTSLTVSVSGTPEDWVTFGRDYRRTGLSSFLGPQSNDAKWSHQTTGAVTSSPSIAVDGTVYVGSEDGFLYAINPDGTREWTYPLGDPVIASPSLDSSGNLYFGSNSGDFVSLTSSGSLRWHYQTAGQIQSNALITPDGTVYVGSGDGELYSFSKLGLLNWKFETIGSIISSPALGIDGNIIFGHSSGNVYSVDSDGNEVWSYLTGAYVASSPAIAADGTIYIGSDDTNLYALNSDGSFKWRYQTDGKLFSSPAIGPSSDIYVGSRDGYVYSVSSAGALNWRVLMADEVWSSPTIGSDGTIYLGCNNHRLNALDAEGTILWFFLAGDLIQSSAAISRDGTLYVGSEDSFLHAIGN